MELFDYLKWRNDVSLRAAPFNEIDNVILSYLAYADFGELLQEEKRRAFYESMDGCGIQRLPAKERLGASVLQGTARENAFALHRVQTKIEARQSVCRSDERTKLNSYHK